MSLLVWIPMVHGDCKDQGLLGVETSVINTVTYVDGKLGKAAQIGNGNQVTNGISINTNLVEELGTQYSCSVWVKPLGNHVHYEGAIVSSGNWNNKSWAFGVNQNNTAVDVFCGGYSRNVTCPVPVNEWTHLVSVNDGTHTHLYKNGELISTITTSSWPLSSDATITTVGRESYASGYFSFNGCVQDLRIYDHALSPLEVKHLAQGLVLHYPLNRGGFGGDNIIAGTSPNEIQYTYPSSSYSDKFQSITTIVPTASQYTLSFWAKSTVNGDKVTSHYYSPNTTTTCVSNQGISRTSSDGNMIFTLSTDWEYYWVTYTQTETTAVKHVIFPRMAAENNQYNLPCIGSGTISVKCVKFEEGSIPTPWIPSPKDNLYSAMALDENIIHDTSGFQNNGELVVIGKNLIDKNNVTSGGYINSAGGITNTSGWNYTNYIKVNPSTSYIASSISSGGSGTYYALYDASKTLTRTVLITASQNPTFTTTAAERYVRFSIRSLSNELDTAKLEEGTTVTGYESEGSIEWETNSPRYTLACNPHSVNSTQNARLGTTYIRGYCALTTPSQLTIAFWCYARNSGYGGNTGHGAFCTTTQVGDSTGADYMISAMNHYDSHVIVNSSDGNTHPKLSIVLKSDEWHHYAFTFDGKNAIAYKDGILVDTKSFSSSATLGSFSSIIIGLSKAGSVWRRNDNTYSDFRVYATALSADDVMALYKNAGYVDSDGNVYAYEITE